jgi:hypothetical protein
MTFCKKTVPNAQDLSPNEWSNLPSPDSCMQALINEHNEVAKQHQVVTHQDKLQTVRTWLIEENILGQDAKTFDPLVRAKIQKHLNHTNIESTWAPLRIANCRADIWELVLQVWDANANYQLLNQQAPKARKKTKSKGAAQMARDLGFDSVEAPPTVNPKQFPMNQLAMIFTGVTQDVSKKILEKLLAREIAPANIAQVTL